jgi:hypothetical protein
LTDATTPAQQAAQHCSTGNEDSLSLSLAGKQASSGSEKTKGVKTLGKKEVQTWCRSPLTTREETDGRNTHACTLVVVLAAAVVVVVVAAPVE